MVLPVVAKSPRTTVGSPRQVLCTEVVYVACTKAKARVRGSCEWCCVRARRRLLRHWLGLMLGFLLLWCWATRIWIWA
ncbi:hypothetical protein ES332_D10G175700v1 [Gossypium tomentosum]|uniref:Uncharacterized protein n=1 Tax=Gossypium tomentosum TaxID=34277 RepID=A0A5D2J575_GOSTO|nr:hypothetical protein ES332_D10G175700v1 [Gossypium tomentosum]